MGGVAEAFLLEMGWLNDSCMSRTMYVQCMEDVWHTPNSLLSVLGSTATVVH